MSFILDALKKSETERQRADAPALYEMKMAPPRRGVALWLIVLAGLLVINVIVLSVVLLRGPHGASQTDASTAAAPPPAAAPLPGPAMTAQNPPTAATPPPAGPVNPAQAPSTPPMASDTPNTAGSGDAADDAPAVEPSRGPGTATGGTAGAGEVPTYSQAASAPGANLPELKLDLHAYSVNPADRFVFLNMMKLQEGQSTPAGVRVERITPDGAILSWQGSRFFLQRQ